MGFETYEQAEKAALISARKSGEERFIIREQGDYEADYWHITDQEGLDTFYHHQEPTAAVSPEGWVD